MNQNERHDLWWLYILAGFAIGMAVAGIVSMAMARSPLPLPLGWE